MAIHTVDVIRSARKLFTTVETNTTSATHAKRPNPEDIQPEADSTPPVMSIVKHLKWFRFGCLPIIIKPHSFRQLSLPLLLHPIVMLSLHNILNISISDYFFRGKTFDELLRFLATVINGHITLPSMLGFFLLYRKDFDKTIRQLIELQLCLKIKNYSMFTAVKIFLILTVGTALETSRFFIQFFTQIILVTNPGKPLIFFAREAIVLASDVWADVYWGISVSMISYVIFCIGASFAELSKAKLFEEGDVQRFCKMYDQLLDVAADINKYYDIPITLILLGRLLFLVLSLGQAINLFTSPTRIFFAPATLLIARNSFHIGALVLVIHACHSSTKHADNANDALMTHIISGDQEYCNYESPRARGTSLSYVTNRTSDKVHRVDMLNALVHLHSKKRLVFKICNCETLDYGFGMSMAAALITYGIALYHLIT